MYSKVPQEKVDKHDMVCSGNNINPLSLHSKYPASRQCLKNIKILKIMIFRFLNIENFNKTTKLPNYQQLMAKRVDLGQDWHELIKNYIFSLTVPNLIFSIFKVSAKYFSTNMIPSH